MSRGTTSFTGRYESMLAGLRARREGAFVPFFVLGDPDLDTSARLLRAAVNAGADALEVGIAFSDPIADGPTLQRASLRAAAAGATVRKSLDLVASLRADTDIPIGLLTYANLVVGGGVESFYDRAAAAGLDSVLVADVPLLEAEPFCLAARARGIAPILLAPPNLPPERAHRIAALSAGYTYVVARKGVTGEFSELETSCPPPAALRASAPPKSPAPPAKGGDRSGVAAGPPRSSLFDVLRAAGAPPPFVGFGISTPAHVRAVLQKGAAGAICGSAVARIIEETPDRAAAVEAVRAFVAEMKQATRTALPG